MELLRAEESRPLYIVEIKSAKLETWLSLAGIEIGDPVWKSSNVDMGRSVWTTGPWGQVIISPKLASGLLVKQENKHVCTLNLLPTGATGRFIDHKNCDRDNLFLNYGKIKKGSLLNIKRKFKRLDFHINVGKQTFCIDDETALNIWSRTDAKWTQLGAGLVGGKFIPSHFTGSGNTIIAFENLMSKKASFLTIKKIIPNNTITDNAGSLILKTKSGNTITLGKDAIEKLDVRLCDICWACGLCKQ